MGLEERSEVLQRVAEGAEPDGLRQCMLTSLFTQIRSAQMATDTLCLRQEPVRLERSLLVAC